MRTLRILAVAAVLMALTIPAMADDVVAPPRTSPVESQPADCVQSDGQPGVYVQGVGSPDDQCLTADEYTAAVSATALTDAGLIAGATDNGDGTTTLDFGNGAVNTIPSDPLDQIVSADAELEPEAPTVREVLFAGQMYRPV